MTSARRPLVLLLLVAVFGAAAAWLVLSPLGLLEESAGPLDGLLPADLDAAVRLDPGTLAWSPAAERLWEHPTVVDARASSGLDEHVLEPLRALEARVGSATLGLAPRLDRDVLGEDVVVAVRGGDVLLLTRLTTRGRLVDAAPLDAEELRRSGLRVEGDTAVLARDGAPAVYLRRVRDVLVATTSPDMLATAAALAEPPAGVPRGPSRYAEALRSGETPGERVLFWARPEALPDSVLGARPDGLAGLLASFFPPDALDVSAGELDLSTADRLALTVRGAWREDLPGALDTLVPDVPGRADGLLAEAARLAVPGEAIATLGLTVRASEAVRTLAEAQPPARRDLLDDILAERGLTVDLLAERIAAHLEDGVAGVVSRLPEADDLELDDPQNGGVHAIPATLVVFRLRSGATPDAVVEELASEAEALFGSPVVLIPEDGPGGARVHRLREHRFGGEWRLLRPAFAVVDGLLVFCTHDEHLLRALAQRADGEPAVPDAGAARTVALHVAGGPLRRWIDDQRWEWADRATFHDWRAERAEIRRELEATDSILSPEDRQVYVDAAIEHRLERRHEREFPAAIERYRASWAPLEALSALTLRADRDGASFRLEIVLVPTSPEPR